MRKKLALTAFLLPLAMLSLASLLLIYMADPELLKRFLDHATRSGGAKYVFWAIISPCYLIGSNPLSWKLRNRMSLCSHKCGRRLDV